MDRLLVLVRHGQSEWNLKNLFTGWKNPDLTEKGVAEATRAGQQLKALSLEFDAAYTSALLRAQRTLDIMLGELGQTDLPITRDQALNERDYGDLSGLNKDDARAKWGEEQVHIWRRSFDTPPPGGESLKDTAARVLPYFEENIWPRVMASIRAPIAPKPAASVGVAAPTRIDPSTTAMSSSGGNRPCISSPIDTGSCSAGGADSGLSLA